MCFSQFLFLLMIIRLLLGRGTLMHLSKAFGLISCYLNLTHITLFREWF
uniref:Uncharacterized protein n=1 Tax=Arundo donax TaxID=35708 RepID=A0A0A9FXN2_ARUDO